MVQTCIIYPLHHRRDKRKFILARYTEKCLLPRQSLHLHGRPLSTWQQIWSPNHWVLQATNRRWSHDDLKFIFCADSAFEAYKIMDKMSLENSVARGSVCQPSLVTRRMTCSLKDNGFVWLRLLGKCNAVISEWALCSIQVLNVLAVITIGR